ncbi:MAG: hypothetical protein LH481_00680 [Burkholderiales bacterium]|nr:hypothetical protein [Burkholderiales bacterium]
MRVIDVPASAGLAWIKMSFALFRVQPVGWITLMLAWLMATLGLSLIPLVGAAIASILQPGFFAGFVIAARDQEAGQPLGVHQLLAAFRVNGRALVTIGSITLLANMMVVTILGLLGLPLGITADADGVPDLRTYARALEGKELLLWLGMALTLMVKGALWFTAALLALNQMPATHAIRWSFYALIANLLPMLIFGTVITVMFILGTLPLLLGLLLVMPLFAIAHYVSYRELFRTADDASP